MSHDRPREHPPVRGPAPHWSGPPALEPTVAIVGGGFCGTMIAANLLRMARVPARILLIERTGTLGAGVAYGAGRHTDLLNVPAAAMSAWPDDPEHFLRWCRSILPQAGARSFLSRYLYGEYVRSVLREATSAAAPGVELISVADQAIAVRPIGAGAGLQIDFRSGPAWRVDVAVLALGNGEAAIPSAITDAVRGSARFLANPWERDRFAAIAPDERVLILGTGLTMVDTVLGLHRQSHRAPILAVSRHGLIPRAHQALAQPRAACALPPALRGHARTVRELLVAVRHEIERASEEGVDWRIVLDSLRPHSAAIWAALDTHQRRSFLRHLAAYWNCHRHRCAPEVAGALDSLRERGWLQVRAAWITGVRADDAGFQVDLRPRGETRTDHVRFDRIINCTGIEMDFGRYRDPLVRQLIADGLVMPTALGLGLRSSPRGAAIDAQGRCSRRLFLIGSFRKADLWESTAVPELRVQAQELGRLLSVWIERRAQHWARS